VGVLHFPALGEVVAAAVGVGCWWNGRRVHVSDVDRLDRALVLATGDTPPGTEARVAKLRRLEAAAGVARTWGDAYGYALVATGRAEVMVDPIVRVWDVAAVRPVIEEAGGVFTDWDGRPDHTTGHAVATNAALADVVREILGAGT
jgi:histidinol-phosphatase